MSEEQPISIGPDSDVVSDSNSTEAVQVPTEELKDIQDSDKDEDEDHDLYSHEEDKSDVNVTSGKEEGSISPQAIEEESVGIEDEDVEIIEDEANTDDAETKNSSEDVNEIVSSNTPAEVDEQEMPDEVDDGSVAPEEEQDVQELGNQESEGQAEEKPSVDSAEEEMSKVENEEGSTETQFPPAQITDVFQILAEGRGDENVDYDLLQRQAKYIMDSDILNLPEFRNLNDSDKVAAILSLLNSNPETSLPHVSQGAAVAPEPEQIGRIPRPDMSQPMNAAERKRYSEYLRGENRITEIQNIPPKSRLFIGNLPLKNVAKEDLFRIFSPYGHIYQINIKNAFGFIQYDNPKSVRDAIEGESQEMNFGKKLILEISSSNSRPQYDHGDHGTNSSSTFISSTKRPFDEEEEEDMYSDNSYKRGKRRVPECVIYVKRTADRSYANDVFGKFRQGTGLETDMIFLKPRMELRKMINDAAYDGVWGVVLVNKTRNVDIQTFYKGAQGETKFDEYVSVSGEDAVAIFNNLKNSRRGKSVPPPQQQPQQPPQQQYYGGYNMGPPPQQSQPHIPQHYVGPPPQGYGAPPMAQSYNAYPAQPPIPAHVVPPIIASAPPPQMDQQQLLSAIQNLPPNVVSSLLSMAQQQPQQQQQLLGIIQSMQPQQMPPHGGAPPANAYQNYQQIPPAMNAPPIQPPQQPSQYPPHQELRTSQHQSPPPQQQHQSSGNNNVQSLLDSLAQLQQK